jgi:outer membrane protein, heavy metal efflux system
MVWSTNEEKPMKRTVSAGVVALLLGIGTHAQTYQHENMPGTKMPSQSPDHQHASEQMEMHSPKDVTSNVSGVQEPENPNQKTGSNLSVPDLLETAKALPARSLDEFEALALKNNPTLKQAEAIARVSAGLARQAGLWPNPSVGYQGEQIRGGSFGGGEEGGFVQQTVPLGGKLGLRRNVFEQQGNSDKIGIQERQWSVRGAVELQFYTALARLRIVEVERKLMSLAADAANTAHQLANVGQADAPDVLQAEVEAEQIKLEVIEAQRDYIQSYEELAAITGEPQTPIALLKGDLDHPPAIDTDRYFDDLFQGSPTLKRAQQEAVRADAELARNKREAIPDLTLRAGVQQNFELLEPSMHEVGVQSFATAGIQIPIFNRNQGNVQAGKAQVERANEEVARVRLQLVQTAQPLLQRYLIGRLVEERYRTQLIPRAQRAYELYLVKYQNMAAAYPEVIVSQRTLFRMEVSYARTLGELWTTAIQLQSYLLADGISAPHPSGNTDTQINLPTGGGSVE